MAIESRVQPAGSTEKDDRDGMEIDLVELLYRLLEKARYIILAALLGALIMAVYTFRFVTPTYTAVSKLYIVNPKDSVINLSDLQLGNNLADDYVEIFNTRDMSAAVKADLNLSYSVNQIKRMVSVSRQTNTRILYISVVSPNREEARDMANAFARQAQILIPEKMKGNEPTFFELAETPTAPSAPNKVRNIALGFILGALVAIAVLVVQFIADDRIRNVDMLEKRLGLPVLGMMPAMGTENADVSSHHNNHKERSHRSGRKGGRA